jgi:hypothetical protein
MLCIRGFAAITNSCVQGLHVRYLSMEQVSFTLIYQPLVPLAPLKGPTKFDVIQPP